jgi:DNA replication protein DnaC
MMDNTTMQMLTELKLESWIEHWEHDVTRAREETASFEHILKDMLEREVYRKNDQALQRRIKSATIPELRELETFPFSRQPKLSKKKVLSLYDEYSYINKHRNIIFIGPTGVGKSSLATSFLLQAIYRGCRGRFVTFSELIESLNKSVAAHTEQRELKKFSRYDPLVIDEIGYTQIDPTQAGLLFTLLSRRYKTASTILTTNLGFSEWPKFLGDAQMAAALIDRLTENAHVLNMKGCKSLRQTHSE